MDLIAIISSSGLSRKIGIGVKKVYYFAFKKDLTVVKRKKGRNIIDREDKSNQIIGFLTLILILAIPQYFIR